MNCMNKITSHVPKLWINSKRTMLSQKDLKMIQETMGKPFQLPPGKFKPKQSLGQNFLNDQNYVQKIVSALKDDSEGGYAVVEIGPGAGALTRLLYPLYPKMRAIELDQRSVEFLKDKIPQLETIHMNVLDANWTTLAAERNTRLNIIGNLPYYIVSQIMFSLADHHKSINKTVLTMQLEVAERLVAKPNTKDYGIPSVVFQLYGQPIMNFKIPPSVFYPKPKVDSALVTLDFSNPHPALQQVDLMKFRRVVLLAFNQRRKMLRQSLKGLLNQHNLVIPEKWESKRPDQLAPLEFIELTIDLFGTKQPENSNEVAVVWRRSLNVNNEVADSSEIV